MPIMPDRIRDVAAPPATGSLTAALPHRVLVTGAAGNLGTAVCADLTDHGVDVVPIDRRGGSHIERVNLLDPAALREVSEECDGAVHLAAYPAPGLVPDEELFANNTAATFHLLTVAAEQQMDAVVIASSASAYGMAFAPHRFSPVYAPIDEDHPMTPQDAYGLSKIVDEQTTRMMVRRHEMNVVALRFHWVVDLDQARRRAEQLDGPSGRAWEDTETRQLWSYVDNRDAAAAARLALRLRDGFRALNICASDTLSPTPTNALMRRYHPDTELRSDLDPHCSPWSTDRARDALGFRPRWTWRSDEPIAAEARGVLDHQSAAAT